MQRRLRIVRHEHLAFTVAFVCTLTTIACDTFSVDATLPAALTDEQFWDLSTRLSEDAGTFEHSDNLVSNETLLPHIVRLLRAAGGVYIGVGPEQNFSYIARIQPAMAFIIDIRQENLHLHLLYKALFEASADRADFVFRLFSRERPVRTWSNASVHELFGELAKAAPSRALYEQSLRSVHSLLTETHRFPLTPQDLESIERIFEAFGTQGPDVSYYYRRQPPAEREAAPSYRELMTSTDLFGESRSYLATNEAFAFVKALQASNLIVPVTGDFGKATAIRRVGDYIREHGGRVTAFYGSNVEVYLTKQETAAFCASLADLPFSARAWFIDGKGVRSMSSKFERCPIAVR